MVKLLNYIEPKHKIFKKGYSYEGKIKKNYVPFVLPRELLNGMPLKYTKESKKWITLRDRLEISKHKIKILKEAQ